MDRARSDLARRNRQTPGDRAVVVELARNHERCGGVVPPAVWLLCWYATLLVPRLREVAHDGLMRCTLLVEVALSCLSEGGDPSEARRIGQVALSTPWRAEVVPPLARWARALVEEGDVEEGVATFTRLWSVVQKTEPPSFLGALTAFLLEAHRAAGRAPALVLLMAASLVTTSGGDERQAQVVPSRRWRQVTAR